MHRSAFVCALLLASTAAFAQPAEHGRPSGQMSLVPLDALAGTYSESVDVNDRGQVLLQSQNEAFFARPVLWDRGELIDLVGDRVPYEAYGLAINNKGQVLGFYYPGGDAGEHGFLVDKGGFQDLGTLGGLTMLPAGGRQSLNERGQVVGDTTTADGEWRAVVWQNGTFTELGKLPGDEFSSPVAINNAGQVVGVSGSGFGEYHGVFWDNGRMTDLGTLGGQSTQPFALNDKGQVVGWSTTGSGEMHAFLWDKGEMYDLGRPGTSSMAYDVNDRGQVIGRLTHADGTQRGFVWSDGELAVIGPLPGSTDTAAWAINNRGQVVGSSVAVADNQVTGSAFLWENGITYDLGVLGGGRLSQAHDINERGDIAGYSYGANDGNQYQQGVLWRRKVGK